jgi:stage III sporulation protein SpoIIIAA
MLRNMKPVVICIDQIRVRQDIWTSFQTLNYAIDEFVNSSHGSQMLAVPVIIVLDFRGIESVEGLHVRCRIWNAGVESGGSGNCDVQK